MKPLLTCMLCLALALGACSKSDNPVSEAPVPIVVPGTPVPQVTEGVLAGTIIPAKGASSVEIDNGGNKRTVTVDPKTGGFSLALPAGDYSIKVEAAMGFLAPETKTFKVNVGQMSSAGELVMIPEGTSKSFQLYVSGIVHKGTLTTKYTNNKFSLTNVETIKQGTGTPEAKIDQYTLAIELPKLNGPGSFPCNATTGATLRYERAVPAVGGFPLSGHIWLAWEGAGTDTQVTITKIDDANRLITGYFSANLASTMNGQSSSPMQCIFRVNY